jgi:transcriptional regulator with PAS, ATPase and Fis domain
MDLPSYEVLLEHIPGAIIIDLEGTVLYLNNQCADYLGVVRENAIGCKVKKVFPDTKMMESLEITKPEIIFYHSFGIGISVHIPIFDTGKKVALLEYDVVQASEMLYELADNYTKFLDFELNNLQKEIDELRKTKYSINNIIGHSDKIVRMKENIVSAAKSSSTVVIFGETGTGKELVAHSIHSLSRRVNNNFVKINAASMPENLVESELFGYEGGTFTGAIRNGKKGKFELANKGTLYIDEVNQMPLATQPKFLRVLQENEIERIGGEQSIPIDARVIVTTNQDLRELVREGKFREDLFYRLNVVLIKIPSLRERKEDIPLLINYFVNNCSYSMGKNITHIDERIYTAFENYEWPGNIRELQNTIERGMNFAQGNYLALEDMSITEINDKAWIENKKAGSIIEEAKKDAERKIIISILKKFDGNKTKSAAFLGISRPLLYQKIKRLGIKLY